MTRWAYEGPVLIFGRCVVDRWRAETIAPTRSKAQSNLAYQYKNQAHLIPSTRVTLMPGKVVQVD